MRVMTLKDSSRGGGGGGEKISDQVSVDRGGGQLLAYLDYHRQLQGIPGNHSVCFEGQIQ